MEAAYYMIPLSRDEFLHFQNMLASVVVHTTAGWFGNAWKKKTPNRKPLIVHIQASVNLFFQRCVPVLPPRQSGLVPKWDFFTRFRTFH